MAVEHYQNQLLFNLGVPATPHNMAVKFRRPVPIIMEKMGGYMPSSSHQQHDEAFNFSSISESSMSEAIQLAKRDLKKQKEADLDYVPVKIPASRMNKAMKQKTQMSKKVPQISAEQLHKPRMLNTKQYKDYIQQRNAQAITRLSRAKNKIKPTNVEPKTIRAAPKSPPVTKELVERKRQYIKDDRPEWNNSPPPKENKPQSLFYPSRNSVNAFQLRETENTPERKRILEHGIRQLLSSADPHAEQKIKREEALNKMSQLVLGLSVDGKTDNVRKPRKSRRAVRKSLSREALEKIRLMEAISVQSKAQSKSGFAAATLTSQLKELPLHQRGAIMRQRRSRSRSLEHRRLRSRSSFEDLRDHPKARPKSSPGRVQHLGEFDMRKDTQRIRWADDFKKSKDSILSADDSMKLLDTSGSSQLSMRKPWSPPSKNHLYQFFAESPRSQPSVTSNERLHSPDRHLESPRHGQGDVVLDSMSATTLENMLEKLRLMEEENECIRQRWATMIYEDEGPIGYSSVSTNTRKSGDEAPREPEPVTYENVGIEPLTSLLKDLPIKETDSMNTSEKPPLLFTKLNEAKYFHHWRNGPSDAALHLGPSTRGREVVKHQTSSPWQHDKIPLSLEKNAVRNIMDYRKQYDAFLAKTSSNSVGRFKPWRLVDEISDEILDDCIQEICEELEHANTELAQHIFQAEFQQMPNETAA